MGKTIKTYKLKTIENEIHTSCCLSFLSNDGE